MSTEPQAETWSYNEWFLMNFFGRGFRLGHTAEGERPQWGDGSPEHPLPAGVKRWNTLDDMMKDNGFERLQCTCWVKYVGNGDKVHHCPLNPRQVEFHNRSYPGRAML